MVYVIKIKEPAARRLRKYDREIQKRFAAKIYTIDYEKKLVTIEAVKHKDEF